MQSNEVQGYGMSGLKGSLVTKSTKCCAERIERGAVQCSIPYRRGVREMLYRRGATRPCSPSSGSAMEFDVHCLFQPQQHLLQNLVGEIMATEIELSHREINLLLFQ